MLTQSGHEVATNWPRPFKDAISMTSEQRNLHSKPYKRCSRAQLTGPALVWKRVR